MKIILQTEAAECSLACLAMVASSHGLLMDLPSARRRFSISSKGVGLKQLMQQAAALNFNTRALRLDIDEIQQLQTPCILHWNLNHFVVLLRVTHRVVIIADPAVGRRKLSFKEFSRHFTGVALEVSPGANFQPQDIKQKISLRQLTGSVRGLPGALAQIFCVALVLEVFAIASPFFNQLVMDDGVVSGDFGLLGLLVVGFGILLVIQTGIALARSWMVMVLSQTLSLQWTSNLFAHLVKLPPSFFERRHLGDVVSRFGSVSAIQKTLTTSVMEAMLDGLMALAAFVMMLIYAPRLAMVTCVAVALYGVTRWAFYGPFRNAAAERLIISARENTHFLESLRAITPLKLFGREQERRASWQNLVVDVQNRDVRTAKMSIAFSAANTFIFGIENLIVFWLGAKMIIDSTVSRASANPASLFTIGMLFAYVGYKAQFTGRISALINYGVELKMLGLHAERLADIALARPEEYRAAVNGADNDLSHLEPSLELRGVSFRYGDGEPWILKGVDLVVQAGQSVALTGASGAGKTTLLKVLLGLLEPSEGDVLYGGIPVRRLGLSNVRRKIGTVMQEDVLLTGTLADNISFFDLEIDMSAVQAAAEASQLHDDIIRMPMGYQTMVGDLGNGLSGGQKQRLLLARALYKKPSVIALDEATSHLDIANERAVSRNLKTMSLTRVLIAHRPETIATAERVVELRDGKVVEGEPPKSESNVPMKLLHVG